MKKLTVFLKQLRLSQILTVFLATLVLFVGTACNSGDIRGARPDNPPVQAGGANNPYKQGGDNNTNFNLSPDPKVSSEAANSKGNRADLQILSNQLIASEQILYPDAQPPAKQADVEKSLPKKSLDDVEKPELGGLNQRESDIGDRIQNRLSAVKKTFDKASEFVKEGANEGAEAGLQRHE